MNFTLIGMPASGKTTIGNQLAQALQKEFVDTDSILLKKYGPLQPIIESDQNHFLQLDEEAICSVQSDNVVISPGGSSVYSEKGMQHLQSISTVIYLKLPLEVIASRLGDYSNRGIVKGKEKTLQELYDERTKLYEKHAHITVACEKDDISLQLKKVVNAILTKEIAH